jgi:hypothetical protein
MNILFWTLQVLLALHTAMGGVWKFSNSSQNMPSLAAIPHGLWLAMGVLELFIAVALVLPAFSKGLAVLVPLAAVLIAAEMLIFCGLHLASGDSNHGQLIYWMVVAGLCAFLAYGRYAVKPL